MNWHLLRIVLFLTGCGFERVPIGSDQEPASSNMGGAGTAAGQALVAYWPLDETTGLTAHDATPNGNDGVLTSFPAPGWTIGKVGGGLTFADGPYVVVPPSPSIHSIAESDALTVAAWVRTSAHGNWFQSVLSVQLENGVWETFGLYIKEGIPTMAVNTGDMIVGECAATRTIPLDTWTHLAGTFDGTLVRTFVNGAEECRLRPTTLDIPRTDNPVLIGSNQNLARRAEFMRGTLDELVLYARALSSEEIVALMAGATSRGPEAGSAAP